MASDSQVHDLINQILADNPTLGNLLSLMADDLYNLSNQINPPTAVNILPSGIPILVVSTPKNLVVETFPLTVRLTWQPGDLGISLYEVRMGGTNWNNATFVLTTATLVVNLDPIALNFHPNTSYIFRIKARDNQGNYSDEISATLSIPQIGAPVASATVITNNVLLSWTIPSSAFKIEHYEIKENGSVVGNSKGTFEAFFRIVSGSFSYTITAIDIVGNRGPESGAVTVNLSAPTDFIRQALQISTFTGTKVNAYAYTDPTINRGELAFL